MTAPTHFYIIASTPRTGSSLLCDVLDATGIAGYPQEFYFAVIRPKWLQLWGLPSDCSPEAFWQASLQHRTTANGWHGVKIHSFQLMRGFLTRFAAARGVDPWDLLPLLYPEAQYIFVRREDRRGQALSFFRAMETGAWCRARPGFLPALPFVDETAPPVLDPAQVRTYEATLEREEQAWRAYFHRAHLTPLEVTYEALCADVQWEVARVLAFVGLPTAAAYCTVPPRLMKQADGITDAWRAHMQEEPYADPRPQLHK